MIKIIGLLNLNELFLFNNKKANIENSVNAAYKLSEDGAKEVVVYGKSFSERKKLVFILKPRLDIPVSTIITSPKQIKLLKNTEKIFSTKEILCSGKKIIPITVLKTVRILKEKNHLKGLLVTNKKALKLFDAEPDYLNEIITVLICKAISLNTEFFITENIPSAKKGAELYKKLF